MTLEFRKISEVWERRIAERGDPGKRAIRDAANMCHRDMELLLDVLTDITNHRRYQDAVDAARERGELDGLVEMHSLIARIVFHVARVRKVLGIPERGAEGRAQGGENQVAIGQVRRR